MRRLALVWVLVAVLLSVPMIQNVIAQPATLLVDGQLGIGGERPWQPGESRRLTLTMTSFEATLFISQSGFTSSCGIIGLPTGFVGHPDQVWEQFVWYVTLPKDAPAGWCTIQGGFTAGWPVVTDRIQLHHTFEIGYRYRQFLPLINNSK